MHPFPLLTRVGQALVSTWFRRSDAPTQMEYNAHLLYQEGIRLGHNPEALTRRLEIHRAAAAAEQHRDDNLWADVRTHMKTYTKLLYEELAKSEA